MAVSQWFSYKLLKPSPQTREDYSELISDSYPVFVMVQFHKHASSSQCNQVYLSAWIKWVVKMQSRVASVIQE